MRKLATRFYSILFLALVSVASAAAQSSETKPVIQKFEYTDKAIIQSMSDNGLWAVLPGAIIQDSEATPKLVDVTKGTTTELSTTNEPAAAYDVTNDGTIVVGAYLDVPAYWSSATKKWTKLPLKTGWTTGQVNSITPDGAYAVGVLYGSDDYASADAMWNMKTGELMTLQGLPTKDMSHQDQKQHRFDAISADGNTILGCMSFSFLPTSSDLGGCFFFVYNRSTASYKAIGFTESDNTIWAPKADGMNLISAAYMSNNGKYVTGEARVNKVLVEGQNADEYTAPFLYDVVNDKFTLYDENACLGATGVAVTNEGVPISATPSGSPIRDWSVFNGKYWFSISDVLKQKYNVDFSTYYTYTGTVCSISDDGKRLSAFPDPYTSYILDLPESVSTVSSGLQLLGAYTAYPKAASEMSHLKEATLTFGYDITAVGGNNTAQLLDEEGNVLYNSVGFSANGKILTVKFRNGLMEEGKTYQLFIPEGAVAYTSDPSQTNLDIHVEYKGREDKTVVPVKIYPGDGTSISKLDNSANPVKITFNTKVTVSDDAKAYLYRSDETEPFCNLLIAYGDSLVDLYPSTEQYLYKDVKYKVVLPAGFVTDAGGNNANDEVTISYTGNYEREISSDDVVLFSDNFSAGVNSWLLYDGDKNTPDETRQEWQFTSNLPWSVVRDNEDATDLIAASHSMYSPAGKSDDWMVIPQLFIPDMLCKLNFQSQSYLNSKVDSLKIIVWESDNVYGSLNADIVSKIKSEGKLVYNKIQSPGASEEKLANDWTENSVSLADFAGKNVYIAFYNDNNDQSAVFVDSVQVLHEMNFLVSFTNESSVVNKESTTIKGIITGNNGSKTYTNITLKLKDADGNLLDTQTLADANLSKGAKCNFEFTKALPLTIGNKNKFSVYVDCDGEVNEVSSYVKDLTFSPLKRIVLEEYTGRGCGNCPLGLLSIASMEKLYGDQFLPISLHCYSSDPLGSGLYDYSSYIGFSAAPSGIINRGVISYPAKLATKEDGTSQYCFSIKDNANVTDNLWRDYAEEELALEAESDISIALNYDEATATYSIPCNIKYALNTNELNVNLFAVILEDSCNSYQENYMASSTNKELGEWGSGGKYGSSVVLFSHMDVCRGFAGSSYAGTSGLLPQSVNAGQVYTANITLPKSSTTIDQVAHSKAIVMMIDANTKKVINAARAKCTIITTGIEDADASKRVEINYADHAVTVKSISDANVMVTNLDGVVLGQATGKGAITIPVYAHNQMIIVKVTSDKNDVVKKFIAK